MKNFIKSTDSFISFALAIALSFIFWRFSPNDTMPLWVVIGAISLFFCFLWLFFNQLFIKQDLIKEQNFKNLEMQKTIQDLQGKKSSELEIVNFINSDSSKECLFLIKSNDYLQHNSLVTFFIYENGYEEYLGTVRVTNIQNDGIIQISVCHILGKPFANRNINDLIKSKSIIIKPIVTYEYINFITSEDNGND